MNKRKFLKAAGVSAFVSLLSSPIFGRREAGSANAQEDGDLAQEIAKLRQELRTAVDKRDAEIKGLKRNLSTFVGAVVAISGNRMPVGWHLCDGTKIPNDPEYDELRELIGDYFPDYRGVFLRGLDEASSTGAPARGYDPGRELNSFQESSNKSHTHEMDLSGSCSTVTLNEKIPDGWHNHGDPQEKAVGGVKIAQFTDNHWTTPTSHDQDNCNIEPNIYNTFQITGGAHTHTVPNHLHTMQQDPKEEVSESRPVNMSVRYIIRYA